MLTFVKVKNIVKSFAPIIFLGACAIQNPEPISPTVTIEEPEPATANVNFSKFVDKVIIASKTPSTIVYEYQDVRVDEVAMLAAIYCQDNGNRNAYLEKVLLYKNNRRRASFYCSSK